ncbi:MAG: LLM class flavin-dependent oxidoreductase [Anaerolineales bacterium]|nr:LLM class flavin-dependent oxidoreductase [Anaerolineales bacterium]
MKFGLALPYNETRNYARWAQTAEQAGWDGCFLGDAIWTEDPMIGLTAMAMSTQHIRLGTLIIPVPLRRPWKIASESLALDQLSDGRLILGLATGATWMGWYAFPDEVTDNQARAGMLDETIEILTRLYQREPFDFDGQHYHLKLTALDQQYYPPQPVQRPRIPIWTPGIWPRQRSIQRALRCDGWIAEKISPEGKPEQVTPADVREMRAYVDASRSATTPFDLVVIGKSGDLQPEQQAEFFAAWQEAGVTWWVEDLWNQVPAAVEARVQQSLPG